MSQEQLSKSVDKKMGESYEIAEVLGALTKTNIIILLSLCFRVLY